jgi:GTPase
MVSDRRRRSRADQTLRELRLLAYSAGAAVVGELIQERRRRDPATLIGSGKAADLADLVVELEADLVIFDDTLSPVQQRNIEQRVACRAIDRTQLILDIFARRARSREGRLQVEFAQLEYRLPRLSGKGILLSRLGGGIGTRGPGETKLESDRRRIRARIQSLKREIGGIREHRKTRRSARARANMPVVALVGYTNAGKSTLFNALTQAQDAAVSDRLFMTLDPQVRRAHLRGPRSVLLIDTVGFIEKLPHELVAAFRATFEETAEAALLLDVVDASVGEGFDERDEAVQRVLKDIGAAGLPRLRVLNKIDCLSAERRDALQAAEPAAILVSARSGEGLERVRGAMEAELGLRTRVVRLRVPEGKGRILAGLHGHARILSHQRTDGGTEMEVELPQRLMERYQEYLIDASE